MAAVPARGRAISPGRECQGIAPEIPLDMCKRQASGKATGKAYLDATEGSGDDGHTEQCQGR